MKHTLVFHTIDIARKIQKLIDFKSAPISLSYSEASTLLVLDSKEMLSQKSLSLILNLEPASIVTLIDKLEKSGLVKRQSANHDRRIYQITLTSKGRDKVDLIDKKSMIINNYLIQKLEKNDAQKLLKILDDLTLFLNEWKDNNSEKNLIMEGGEN